MGRGKRGKRARQEATPCGIALLDKPVGITSRDALQRASRRLGLKAAGHCGTLDPLASGLIILCSGFATRVQDLLMGHSKTYVGEVIFGVRSDSGDAEGPLHPAEGPIAARSADEIREATRPFIGRIRQRPPAHSAVRVDGERLYLKARRGEEVVVPEREVVVYSFELEDLEWPRARFVVDCGPGTYIRSLARDLGEVLGCGAYLAALRRTRSGAFDLSRAKDPEDLEAEDLLPLEEALRDLPRLDVNDEGLARLLAGQQIRSLDGSPIEEDTLAWHDDKVVARLRSLPEERCRMKRLIVPPDEPTG